MVTKKITTSNKRKDVTSLAAVIVIILLFNFVGSFYFERFDLTTEKRYTLAESTKNLLKNLDDEVYLKVYLNGDFDPSFTRLKNEAREILDEFRAYSKNQIQYEFITPGEGVTPEEKNNLEKQLYEKGLMPEEITMRSSDKTTQNRIWPGAIISHKGKETVWQIFNRQSTGVEMETSINNSVEELEYSLTNSIRKLQRTKRPEVTFIQGHHELDTIQQYSFMKALSEYYDVNQTTITPGRELRSLKGSDAIIISKPDSAFTDKEIYTIDQYIMNGGKVLWLIDPVYTNLDSLRTGFTLGLNRPLNIEEMLFKYGVRLNPILIQDIQCSYLKINTGFQKGQPKFELLPWVYSPLVLPDINHPIVKNLDLIKFDFLSTIDTITSARNIKKTILLKTSKYTKTQPTPARISLAMTKMKLKESQFINSYQPVACLLEGEFTSFVENRLPSVLLNDTNFKHIDHGKNTKMIVVADGDVAKNEYARNTGQVYPLGYDRNTQQTFANKTFLVNCVNYLLDDEGMLQLRSREVKLRLLDKKKIKQQHSKWQFINVAMPLLIVIAFASIQFYIRKRKYAAAK
ncbi:gliding motility-associated ABC transporter substrate-binding protein GldG [Aurantibacillus circumpalustris]|uniref:gliding motility-associated ABC transporter substrate-binding protein GldG n=1 Tax=Aurantibacillus circumpalustris TaxID=3036359 RepID=UPI00295C07DC|nr:gliding motility-associated ABC transporter substrate-binding protein GldG [Aurantibacillus circumpalustris]